MSDHEQDQPITDSPEPVPEPSEQDYHELGNDNDDQHADPVSNTGIDPGAFTEDFGDPDPDDNPVDHEATASDLEDSDIENIVAGPGSPHTDMTIRVSNGVVTTDYDHEPDEQVTSVEHLHPADLQNLQRVLSEESARRGVLQPRPFEHMSIDDLAVLYQQVRTEMASR